MKKPAPLDLLRTSFHSLLTLKTLEELSLTIPSLPEFPSLCLENLKKLEFYFLEPEPEVLTRVLASCPSIQSLGILVHVCTTKPLKLTVFLNALPLSLRHLELGNVQLDCGLPEALFGTIETIGLKDCEISENFWSSPTPSLRKLAVDMLDEHTALYLAGSLCSLKEFHVTRNTLNARMLTMSMRLQLAIRQQGFNLERLSIPGRVFGNLIADSPCGEALKSCSNLSNLNLIGIDPGEGALVRFSIPILLLQIQPFLLAEYNRLQYGIFGSTQVSPFAHLLP